VESATLGDIYEGANRSDYQGTVELHTCFPVLLF